MILYLLITKSPVSQLLKKKLDKGYLIGPFDPLSFKNLITFTMFCVCLNLPLNLFTISALCAFISHCMDVHHFKLQSYIYSVSSHSLLTLFSPLESKTGELFYSRNYYISVIIRFYKMLFLDTGIFLPMSIPSCIVHFY